MKSLETILPAFSQAVSGPVGKGPEVPQVPGPGAELKV